MLYPTELWAHVCFQSIRTRLSCSPWNWEHLYDMVLTVPRRVRLSTYS